MFTPCEEGWANRADEVSRWGVSLHWLHSNLEFDSQKQAKMTKYYLCPRMIMNRGKDSGRKASEETTMTLNRLMEESCWV